MLMIEYGYIQDTATNKIFCASITIYTFFLLSLAGMDCFIINIWIRKWASLCLGHAAARKIHEPYTAMIKKDAVTWLGHKGLLYKRASCGPGILPFFCIISRLLFENRIFNSVFGGALLSGVVT